MRLRNIPGSREEMLVNPYVINEPEQNYGHWKEFFHNTNPLHIEIGMGKGKFITTLAKEHPEINYIGIERFSSVLIRAIEKQEELDLPNLRFLRFDAEDINTVFAPEEVDLIYLNFSDPWPKDRHAKRRLTSTRYFERYDHCINHEHGFVAFKTDNRPLFDFSVEQVTLAGWKLADVTYDLHHSEYFEGNVMTEYEERFSSMGNPICRLVAFPTPSAV